MHGSHVKFIIAGVLLTTGVLVIGIVTLGDPKISMIHYTPDQFLRADPTEFDKRGIQVDGYVAEGTAELDRSVPELRFQVRDVDKTAYIDVVYRAGLKPDSFEEGQGVVVDGRYDASTGTIHASKLVTKCPSKYEVAPDGPEGLTTDLAAAAGYPVDRDRDVAGGTR